MKIGIIGNGFVGKATGMFGCEYVQVLKYDVIPEYCEPKGTSISHINACDLIFVCVPTPLSYTGACQTHIIETVLSQLDHQFIVIRSTIPIGYSDSVDCFFMPEFLTEMNWKEDFIKNKDWILGTIKNCSDERKCQFVSLITQLITSAHSAGRIQYHNIVWCTNKEAEMTKLIRNSFLATKVSFFNEMYDLAQALHIQYDNVVRLVGLDSRIGKSHMKVPSASNSLGIVKRGFAGTCFPKDTNSIFNLLISHNVDSIIVEHTLYRNEYHDRRERDWLSDYGRTLLKTDKKIILVCGDQSRRVCEELVAADSDHNIIIHIWDNENTNLTITHKNLYSTRMPLTKKLFFPKIDKIYYHIDKDDPTEYPDIRKQSLSIMNLIELAELHQCEFDFDGNKFSTGFYDAYSRQQR